MGQGPHADGSSPPRPATYSLLLVTLVQPGGSAIAEEETYVRHHLGSLTRRCK